MEVVKYNNVKELIEIACPACGSILRCTPKEREKLPCPVCGHTLMEELETKTEKGEHLLCETCNYEFYSSISDGIGVEGLFYTYCPECGEKVYWDDGIDITAQNLQIEHFYPEGGKPIDFPTVKKWIATGVAFLKKNPDCRYHYTASGDSFILILREEDEYYVMYTNNYKYVYLKN